MTLKKFVELEPEEIKRHFQALRITIDQGEIDVLVEKSLIPPDATAAEIETWAATNARLAKEMQADGRSREAGGRLHERWRWVRRILHDEGSVTILDAGGQ